MCVRWKLLLALMLLGLATAPAPAQSPAPIATADPTPYFAPPPNNTMPSSVVFASDEACGPPGHAWIEADYLLWRIRGFPTPPLVTTNPTGTPRASVGLLLPGTDIVVGGEHLNDEFTNGFRVRGGFWLDSCKHTGLDIGFLYFLPIEQNYTVGPLDSIISRPFFNPTTGQQNVRLVAFPDTIVGNIDVKAETQIFGGEANMLFNVFCCDPAPNCDSGCGSEGSSYQRLDFLFGYKYFRLTDRLRIEERQRFLVDDAETAGTGIITRDHFWTTNDINAANVAFNYRWQCDRLSISARAALGLGWLKTTTQIDGQTIVARPGASAFEVINGGFLAEPTNSGERHAQRFTLMPELQLTAGYQMTDRVCLHAGWTALYINRILRAGDQIDGTMNPTQFQGGALAGVARPEPKRNYSDLFLNGVNLGIEVRY